MFQTGNTIRLTCSFFGFDGKPANPQIVRVIIYDVLYKKIKEVTLTETNKIKDGEYYFDYIPTKEGRVYYEWYGEIAGNPSIKRGTIEAKFI